MFDDLSHWARGDGLQIVLIAVGAVLLARLGQWVAGKVMTDLHARTDSQQAAGELPDDRVKHMYAVTQVLSWVFVGLTYFVAFMLIIARFGLPLTSLVAPAAVAGVAIGFGAQRVVQDLLSGFFVLVERQYGFGDVIRISPPGTTTGITGTVEEVTLRATKLRTYTGELVIIPNGEIRQVTNTSRDWARTVIDVPVAVGTDIAVLTDVLRRVCEEAFADATLRPLLLDRPSVMGVEHLDVESLQLRVVARTQPGKQNMVGRDLRSRIASAMRQAGIVAAIPTLSTDDATSDTLDHTGADAGSSRDGGSPTGGSGGTPDAGTGEGGA
jgi:small conductance mechanosensitive channel